LCDMCADRLDAGKKPTCVHHCLASCIEYGPIEDLAKRVAELGSSVSIFKP
jgi:Fe-S-cluster-containing dehydrogenase component